VALALMASPFSSEMASGTARGTASVTSLSTTVIDVVEVEARYQLGDALQIQARIIPNAPLAEAFLFYQADGATTEVLSITPDSRGRFDIQIDLSQHTIPPFTRVFYWFHLVAGEGEEFTSPSYWFDYLDNRFEWQSLEDEAFRIHWYGEDMVFGQTILNTAHAGLKSVQEIIPLPPNPPIVLYVYANANDLQTTRRLASNSWAAGYTNPDLGVGLVSIRPGNEQKLEAERQVPHEIAHLLLYRWAGTNYANLPAWLVEGIASASELYTDPDYDRALRSAVTTDQLIPTGDLCQSLPQDPSRSFLAYAQSASFVRFLHQQVGTNRLQALTQSYIGGLGCEEGFQQALQVSLNQMENQWRREALSQNLAAASFRSLLPYFALLAIVLGVPLMTLSLFKIKAKNRGSTNHGHQNTPSQGSLSQDGLSQDPHSKTQ